MTRSATEASIAAAEAYEALHAPALFAQWAGPVLEAAHVAAGDHVIDVACGTGLAARAAVARVGPIGHVAGVDIDPGMIALARTLAPGVDFRQAPADRLPFDDASFDAAVSSFGLMFYPDRLAAAREMRRILRPGGRAAVAVWDALDRSEPYSLEIDLLARHAGSQAADALRAPFSAGDRSALEALLTEAGLADVTADTHVGTARFPSVRGMVEADLRGWLPVMGVALDESRIETILAEAEIVLTDYVTADGTVVFEAPAHIAVGVRV